MNTYWNKYPELLSDLKEVKAIMKNTIGHPSAFIRDPIFQMIDSGGKMLRPAMLILSSKFGKYDPERVLPLAAAVELFHTATLIHDDIIDDSKIRRNTKTIQSQFGKDVAVYSGDYIIARSFMLIHEEYDQQMLRNLSKKIVQICTGELKQYTHKYDSNISVYEYIKIVAAKTAALFAMSMYTGARLGDLDEKTARLFGLAGLKIGIAYQIIDDCLDYCGTDDSILKSARNDLKQGFYTLPLICALKYDKDNTLKTLLNTTDFNDDDILKIYHLVIDKNGITKAKEYAMRYTQKAYAALERLPECNSRTILKDITHSLLERQY